MTDSRDVVSTESGAEAPALGEDRGDPAHAFHTGDADDAAPVRRAASVPACRGADGGRRPGQLRGRTRGSAQKGDQDTATFLKKTIPDEFC